MEQQCNELTGKIKIHILSAKQREENSAKAKKDEEEATRAIKAALEATTNWDQDKKKDEEIERIKGKMAVSEAQQALEVADLKRQLCEQTKNLQGALQDIKTWKVTSTQHKDARDACWSESIDLKQKRTEAEKKINIMIEN